jgi:hypothetical protein
MDSPYKPGFGARPAVLVGRDRQLARASAALTRVANSRSPAPSALVLTGARGMGKTVTLGVVAERGRDRDFVTAGVSLDSVSDNVQLIATRVAESLKDFENRGGRTAWERVRDRLAALSIEVNAGVVKVTSPPARDRAATQSATQREALAALLADGARLAAERDRTGLAIFVDELQEAPHADLVVIANAIQDALMAEDAPLAVFAAGLPQTPERVMAAASFTERFDFRTLERLDDDSGERALVEPALALKVHWDVAAARAVLASAAGSPYLIQRLGDETWTVASPVAGGALTEAQAREAIAEVQESLSNGMFRGRWVKATPAERDLMVAIAQVVDPEGVAQTRHITEVIGRTTPQLSSARQGLFDKGLAEAAGHGRLRFTMPGFAEFVRTQTDTPWYRPSGATSRAALPYSIHGELPPGDRPQLPRGR